MSQKSKIEWTENTWNPVTGCSKISAGCMNCYAEKMAKRLHAMNNPRYINGFDVTLHHDLITLPLNWKKPSMIFVNSMSDLFHEDIPIDFIQQVFYTMNCATQHTFQILTKRSKRLLELSDFVKWTNNIWMGVTVEDSDNIYRIQDLIQVPSKIKFISFEPLINDVGIVDLTHIDWAIVGGESGTGARPIKEEWILNIKNQCQTSNTAFYFKQWGGVNKKKSGRLLLGKLWEQYPAIALENR